MANDSGLRWSDVWFLTSLYMCGRGEQASLEEIVMAADCINHAVMTFEEISSALVRLERAELIVVSGPPWKVRCTQAAIDLFGRLSKRSASAFTTWHRAEKALAVQSWVPKEPLPHPENNLTYPGFSPEDSDKLVSKRRR